MNTNITIERIKSAKDLPMPTYQTDGSSGMDLHANVQEDFTLNPGEIQKISVGIKLKLPVGYEAQVRPRSSLGAKYGITLANSVGTIDSDYRGEIFVPLINLGKEPFIVKRGERVAQMIIATYTKANIIEDIVENDTDRGAGGFGSTGK
ncbi:MAG: dUTP diphosphatase [Lachnospirales bacterium]